MRARAFAGYPPLLGAVLLRAAILWAMLRAILFLLRADLSGPLPFAGVCLLIGAIALLDARVTRETLFLRNLGLPPSWLFGITTTIAAGLEAVLRSIVR